jgi:hypothetical protein
MFEEVFQKIHKIPDLFAVSMQPGGPFETKCSMQFLRGNTNIGGTAFPLTLTPRANVTKVLLSAEVMNPSYLTPFLVMIYLVLVRLLLQSHQRCRCLDIQNGSGSLLRVANQKTC